MISKVTAVVSRRQLEFTPDNSFDAYNSSINSENTFEVEVTNNSDKFASFQLELSTPGMDENSQVKWCNIEPEVCAKKPPGSKTKFQVAITKAPIPAYDTTIDLILRVFSVEDANLYTSQKLKLKINKPLRPLRVEMPVKVFKVAPNDKFEIPVLVYNLSSKFSHITLICSGLNPDWMTKGVKRKLDIEPGDFEKTIFWCQPSKLSLSKEYKFKIEVKSDTTQYPASESGVLEIIPDGVVEFSCSDKQQIIPTKKSLIPGEKSKNSQNINSQKTNSRNIAKYELTFWNDSNLVTQVDITVPEQYQKLCNLEIPEPIKITPTETKIMSLIAAAKRHWFGRTKNHKFTVSPILSSPVSGELITDVYPKPSTEVLELKILPIIPFWAQLGGLMLIPLLILLKILMHEPTYHTGPVNSVRFFGNGSLVFSGSSDQTIRRWQVEEGFLYPGHTYLKAKGEIADAKSLGKAVRVIRQSPKDNDVIAVGLENGEVKLWDISANKLKNSFSLNKANRVFDLVFTQNSHDYLFSAHGNGLINQWDLKRTSNTNSNTNSNINTNKTRSNPIQSRNFDFAISALAIDESKDNNPLIISAGRFNKMVAWQPKTNKYIPIRYEWKNQIRASKKKNSFIPVMGQQHYITSLSIENNVLASADNQGYITLWDLNKIRQCILKITNISTKKAVIKSKLDIIKNNNNQSENTNYSCDNAIIEQWHDGHDKQPVRSVALTQNGDYLASTGDDGRIIIWKLKEGGLKANCQQEVAYLPDIKFNSVDIKKLTQGQEHYFLLTSGDDDNNVKLYRKGMKDNANCQ
ncbi:WD40 repeat domain-containing protein [Mastigocoleus testarum]|uniref:WD40 repeat-containing protein n=1 Tax=Mastigocoleus testarum BC008 TaxID=371196 RepID=A0A0V7ZTZ1_9CYAN|nr:hypothetical protein [Mastigocoleus testarum]KST67654.1 hypothetical protein BC008_43630 [Mastigocoleus testarum BC008]